MEQSNNRLIFLACLFGLVVMILSYTMGLEEGYKKGQIDALNGNLKYSVDTTKVINYIIKK